MSRTLVGIMFLSVLLEIGDRGSGRGDEKEHSFESFLVDDETGMRSRVRELGRGQELVQQLDDVAVRDLPGVVWISSVFWQVVLVFLVVLWADIPLFSKSFTCMSWATL